MESKLARIVKTFSFRLALVYVGLFSLSVVLLFGFIYTFSMNYLERQISDSIRMQYYYLLATYRENGSEETESRIRELVANDPEGTEIHLLVNRENEKLAGNLNEWPDTAVPYAPFEKEGKWVHFYIEDSRGDPKGIKVKALMVPLSEWRSLLVGQSLQSHEKIEKTIIQTFWASMILTLIMAFIGALVMTRSVMQRITAINRSANRIMRGHLSARFPYTVGGDEFDGLSANLNLMLDTIERLLESLAQFANNIAHDLRSPLNRIISRLDAGLRSIDRENPSYTLLEENIRDLEELVGTFNSILKISELEANTEFRNFESCDLQRIIENLAEFYEPYAAEKNITLTTEVSGPVIINGEKNLLQQAIANLIDNAIKFTPEGGRIKVSLATAEGMAHVTIADSGTGIPRDYRDKVFEKFFRMEQSRHTKGNGLGLSLVAAILRIHSATIRLEDNEPGLKTVILFEMSRN